MRIGSVFVLLFLRVAALVLVYALPGVEVAWTQVSAAPAVAAERTSPIRIDGPLDEAAWQAAMPVGGFLQAEPVEGAVVDQPTEVRILFDAEALYIGARMFDDSPASIARQLVRRDEQGQYDYFEVSLDPGLDPRTGYPFRVTAAGVQIDDYLFDDAKEDRSWNAVWESGVQRDERGWTAEIRIPLSQIRFQPSATPQEWGVNFGRRRLASNEVSFFALESRRQHGRVSVFGTLSGLVLPRGVRRLEARPYTLARSRTGPTQPGNPFFDGREESADAGLHLRYGLGSNFTLDATVNPDFGQVEVDPAVINLSAFETIYPERRPFFVEDARIFDFGLSGGSLFYSRRIGRAPSRSNLQGSTFVNAAEETSILGAAKLTGRTNGGLSLGVLAAVTGREEAEAYFAGADSMAVFLAEPRSEYGVVRAVQELRGGQTLVGGIATLMHRNLPSDGTFDFLPSAAMATGVNFEHSWNARAWALWGFVAGTHVQGSEQAMMRLQRAPTHYFQRPDAYGLGVDSSATSMTGAEWRLQLDRRSGRWTGAVWGAQRSPGFEVNDLGQFNDGERLDGGARLVYREITPGDVFRDYSVGVVTFHNFRHEVLRDPVSWDGWGRAHSAGIVAFMGNATFLNYWGLNAQLQYDPENLDSKATRGGPLMLEPAAWRANFVGSTDRRKTLTFQPNHNLQLENDGVMGLGWRGAMKVSYRPSSRVEIETEPSYQSQPDAAQYVAATGDFGYTATYGRRYLFGELDRRTVSLPTRLNVTFSPGLALQLFAQPLLSVGDFTAYKQLARAESFDFDIFEEGAVTGAGAVACVGGRTCRSGDQRLVDFDGDGRTDFSFRERDFRVRSLRGNAVLRWEYRPGSTLFFVWQQRRSYQDLEANTFRLGGEALDLLTDQPANVFIIKASYWLSL